MKKIDLCLGLGRTYLTSPLHSHFGISLIRSFTMPVSKYGGQNFLRIRLYLAPAQNPRRNFHVVTLPTILFWTSVQSAIRLLGCLDQSMSKPAGFLIGRPKRLSTKDNNNFNNNNDHDNSSNQHHRHLTFVRF